MLKRRIKAGKYIETGILLVAWLALFISPMLVSFARNSFIRWEPVFELWKNMLPYLMLSLINHYLLVPYLFFRKKVYYFLSLLITLAVFAFALYHLQEVYKKSHNELPHKELREFPPGQPPGFLPPHPADRMPEPGNAPGFRGNRPPLLSNLPPYISSLLLALLIIGFDTGMRAIFRWMKTEQENTNLEKERIKSELAFLRNQVSPHFFMNTLNNIHSLIDIDTEEAKEALIRLSKMMRHLLYESEQNKIALKKEIEFIQSYIDLMKLRFTDEVKIDFITSAIEPDIEIPPLLFTSLIENAFKYGVSYQMESFISIVIKQQQSALYFEIKNSIATTTKSDNHSGIGLENTRKRLDILYADKYTMDVQNDGSRFSVHLKIPL